MKQEAQQSLERILEAATIVSWKDLLSDTPAGLIHIEYGFAAGGTLDYLKFWSSLARGHWLLACTYCMSASTFHDAGARFEDGHRSKGLADILNSVMQHQRAFLLPSDLGGQGLLKISSPTEAESLAASSFVNQAMDRLSKVSQEIVVV